MDQLSDYQFDLPPQLVADRPAPHREDSRLLVVDRKAGNWTHATFSEISRWIRQEDLLILNNTKVLPARLEFGQGNGELLLIEETSPGHWLAIGRPSKKIKPHTRILLDVPEGESPCEVEILKTLPSGERVVRFLSSPDFEKIGKLPLPPYILKARKERDLPEYTKEDLERYQTVYAQQPGSVAAPTAGLHFTSELLSRFQHDFLTLHVGIGTFRPVKVADLANHEMHSERYEIPKGLKERACGKKIVAVGTTVCRVLESVPDLRPGKGQTRIFIRPPYEFKRTDALVTNFHLPGSSLLMLVAAFMGYDLQRAVYEEAIREKYRFFSYGDAMLIL